jgi:hypothetical protein
VTGCWTGYWTEHGLYLTGRVRSVLRVCARAGLLIGYGSASGHSRPNTSGHSRCLLDSDRTLALWRLVRLTACPVTVSLERCSGLTSASGPLRDQHVRSCFARRVRATSASGQCDYSVFKCLMALFEGVCL